MSTPRPRASDQQPVRTGAGPGAEDQQALTETQRLLAAVARPKTASAPDEDEAPDFGDGPLPSITAEAIASANQARDREYQQTIAAYRRQKALEARQMADFASGRARRPPISAFATGYTADETECYDSDGLPAGDPLQFQKWVPTRVLNTDLRESTTAISRHLAQGFELVKDRGTGEEHHGALGVLMQISAPRRALREIQMAPAGAEGSADPQDRANALLDMAEADVRSTVATGGLRSDTIIRTAEHGARFTSERAEL